MTVKIYAVTLAAVALVAPPLSTSSSRSGQAQTIEVLRGAIDVHVHSDPDNVPRSMDGIDVAKLARAKGMRGVVLKNHYDPTAGLAFLARKDAPGLEVFGGVDLNLPVGGMNTAAVEHMTQVAGGWGRVVWMSTFDAENQVRFSKENRPFVSVAQSGELLPDTKSVIAVIAKRRLVLATGHTSAEEALLLLREGRRQGVEHMIVTHAMNPPVLMDVTQMQEAAKQGAFIEFVGGSLTTAGSAARIDRYADAIRKVGPNPAFSPRTSANGEMRCRPMASPRTCWRCATEGSPGRKSRGWRTRTRRDCSVCRSSEAHNKPCIPARCRSPNH